MAEAEPNPRHGIVLQCVRCKNWSTLLDGTHHASLFTNEARYIHLLTYFMYIVLFWDAPAYASVGATTLLAMLKDLSPGKCSQLTKNWQEILKQIHRHRTLQSYQHFTDVASLSLILDSINFKRHKAEAYQWLKTVGPEFTSIGWNGKVGNEILTRDSVVCKLLLYTEAPIAWRLTFSDFRDFLQIPPWINRRLLILDGASSLFCYERVNAWINKNRPGDVNREDLGTIIGLSSIGFSDNYIVLCIKGPPESRHKRLPSSSHSQLFLMHPNNSNIGYHIETATFYFCV